MCKTLINQYYFFVTLAYNKRKIFLLFLLLFPILKSYDIIILN